MKIFPRLLQELYRVAAKYRCTSIVVGAAALAVSSLGISGPALAADECGALVGGSATCTSADNPYATGISYTTSNTPINLTLLPGVQVITNATVANAVGATGGDITITPGTGVTINNTANPQGTLSHTGLQIQSTGAVAIIGAPNSGIDVNGLLADAGFSNIDVTTVDCMWDLNSPDELFEIYARGTVRVAMLLAKQPPQILPPSVLH